MNFLEQLVAEWYQYKGYFVRTNIRFGRNATGHGGHVGEIDVVAYNPTTQHFVHIEASTDADSWEDRKNKFIRKFSDAREYYMEIFPFKQMNTQITQIALVGFNRNQRSEIEEWTTRAPEGSSLGDITIKVNHIPNFFDEINTELNNKDPQRDAIPETFPLLRAIQYSVFYRGRNN
jgi:Holliday junction resolvase-like predicted endonuclease